MLVGPLEEDTPIHHFLLLVSNLSLLEVCYIVFRGTQANGGHNKRKVRGPSERYMGGLTKSRPICPMSCTAAYGMDLDCQIRVLFIC